MNQENANLLKAASNLLELHRRMGTCFLDGNGLGHVHVVDESGTRWYLEWWNLKDAIEQIEGTPE